MSSKEEVYIMQSTDEEWVSPTPVAEAITEALTRETDLSAEDLGSIESDLDQQQLATVLEGAADSTTVTVAGHDVTVHASGDISVDD